MMPRSLTRCLKGSFFSGQVWSYIIITYFKTKTKGNNILSHKYTKIAVGILWFTLIALPFNLIKHGVNFNFNAIMENSLPCILLAIAIQAIIFAYLTTFKTER